MAEPFHDKDAQPSFLQDKFWTAFLAFAIAVISLICFNRWRRKEEEEDDLNETTGFHDGLDSDGNVAGAGYRFRKRDKIEFYGRKLYRKMRSLSNDNSNARGGKGNRPRREQLMKPILSKFPKLFRKPRAHIARPVRRPPSSFFEVDPVRELNSELPEEIVFMLKNIRVFGHFETPFFMEICRHVETIHVAGGENLFQPGDVDDSIYVLKSGQLSIFIRTFETECEVKRIEKGESILSLLSILDVLTGHAAPFKTVCARANVDSVVLKLEAAVFSEIFDRYPESWLRAIQIIMLRLQRVTLTTLHDYLGLTNELLRLSIRERHPSERVRHPSQPLKFSLGHPVDPKGAGQTTLPCDKQPHPTDAASAALYTHEEEIPLSALARHGSEKHRNRGLHRVHHHSGDSLPKTLNREQSTTDESLLATAKQHLKAFLNLEDDTALDGKLEVKNYPPGYVIIQQGSPDATLMYIIVGSVDLYQKSADDDEKENLIAVARPREMVGALAVITGEPSFYAIKTRQLTRLISIKKSQFYEIMQKCPRAVLNVAHSVTMRVSSFIRSVDFALGWDMVDAGKALFSEGDPADSLYVVLSGRLRAVVNREHGSGKEMITEFGRGDVIGLVEVLTDRPRPGTVMAIRYSELAKLPSGLLNYIKFQYPQVMTRIITLLGSCFSEQNQKKADFVGIGNLNTIAIISVSSDVPLLAFTLELCHSFHSMSPTLRLSSDVVLKQFGSQALDSLNELRLSAWLSQQEDSYRYVVYQCDPQLTSWTRRCIRQADCVLIVANGFDKPTVGPFDRQLEQLTVRAQKKLVLLWKEETEHPRATVDWLDVQGWVSSHYHVRCPHRMFSKRSVTKLMEIYENVFLKEADKFSDFSRLARILAGQSIGLVLGGGGARGASHIGVIKALREFGIPVDMVGGVSIGAFVGGLFGDSPEVATVHARAKEWFKEMSSFWNKLWDLTYPCTAIFTGSTFNYTLKSVFRRRQIEDLWLPYFTVTTDITASEQRVHTAGSLWQYCRASMSLAGYFPPLCDPEDGHLLLDGGYVNNLPADVMRSQGAKTVIAIDVGGQDERDLTNYGDRLSGWWVLWHRWNPWAKPVKVLSLAEVQSKLAYVCCMRQMEHVKRAPYCHYIRPPIDRYQTLDFPKFEEIYDVGYQHAKALFDVWLKSGKLSEIFSPYKTFQGPGSIKIAQTITDKAREHSAFTSSPSFTDLAALVSKIQKPIPVAAAATMEEDYATTASDESDYEEEEDEDCDQRFLLSRRQSVPLPKEINDLIDAYDLEGYTTDGTDQEPPKPAPSLAQQERSDSL